MRRPTGAAGARWRVMQSPPAGFAQSLGGNLQPAQSERNFRKLFRHEALEMRRIWRRQPKKVDDSASDGALRYR